MEQLPFYNKDQIIHQSFALFILSSCSSLVEMVQKPATPPPFLKSAFAKMSPEAASTISACVMSTWAVMVSRELATVSKVVEISS